jgi:hypothetical protein
MSAFILSDLHFSVIAKYVNKVTNIDTQIIADKLKSINIESVNHRYNEKTRKTKCKIQQYNDFKYSTYDTIRLIECWQYQSCENTDNLDYRMMYQFLISLFSDTQIEYANTNSKLWSI